MKKIILLIYFLLSSVTLINLVYAQTTCTDEDGGVDYFEKGKSIVPYQDGAFSSSEICLADVSSAQKDIYVLWGVISSGDVNNNNILIESSCIAGVTEYPTQGDGIIKYLSSLFQESGLAITNFCICTCPVCLS